MKLVAGPSKLQQPPSHTPTCTVTRSPLASCTPRASRTRSLTDVWGLGQETEEQRRRAPRRRRAPSMPGSGAAGPPGQPSSPAQVRRSRASSSPAPGRPCRPSPRRPAPRKPGRCNDRGARGKQGAVAPGLPESADGVKARCTGLRHPGRALTSSR